jgi:carbon starvation protein
MKLEGHELDRTSKTVSIFAWLVVGLLGSAAVAVIAVHRGEPINALWLVVAATCC